MGSARSRTCTNVYVEPALRDEGLGARLLDAAMAERARAGGGGGGRLADAAVGLVLPARGFGAEAAPLGMDLAGD